MIDNCLGVTAIGLSITGVGFLSTIVAAPAVIGMEATSIVMGFLGVSGNRATKMLANHSMKEKFYFKQVITLYEYIFLS